jgi:hypothetical protein
MSHNPIYTVTPLADVPHAVRIETMVPHSPFYDESHPVILQSTVPETLPLLQAFLSGLSLNTSWMGRESRGTAYIKDGVLPDGRTELALSHAMNSRRPSPTEWYCILSGDEDELLELSMVNETLAHQIFDALVAGTLQLRSTNLDPVHP